MRIITGLARELRPAPTHRDLFGARLHSRIYSHEQIAQAGRLGHHQQDRGAGRNRVRPFHVQRRLQGPAAIGSAHLALRVQDLHGRSRQGVSVAKNIQIVLDRSAAISIHDGDDLSRAVGGDLVHPVRMPNHCRGIAVRAGGQKGTGVQRWPGFPLGRWPSGKRSLAGCGCAKAQRQKA